MLLERIHEGVFASFIKYSYVLLYVLCTVYLNDASLDFELVVEADLHEAAEPGRVVVAYRLCIP